MPSNIVHFDISFSFHSSFSFLLSFYIISSGFFPFFFSFSTSPSMLRLRALLQKLASLRQWPWWVSEWVKPILMRQCLSLSSSSFGLNILYMAYFLHFVWLSLASKLRVSMAGMLSAVSLSSSLAPAQLAAPALCLNAAFLWPVTMSRHSFIHFMVSSQWAEAGSQPFLNSHSLSAGLWLPSSKLSLVLSVIAWWGNIILSLCVSHFIWLYNTWNPCVVARLCTMDFAFQHLSMVSFICGALLTSKLFYLHLLPRGHQANSEWVVTSQPTFLLSSHMAHMSQ